MKGTIRYSLLMLAAAALLALGGCRGTGRRAAALFSGNGRSAAAAADSLAPLGAAGRGGLDSRPEAFAPGDSVPEALLASRGPAAFFSAVPVDSAVFARMSGRSYRDGCPVEVEDLRYLRVLHRDLSGRTLVGEMVANKSIAGDLLEIFRELYDAGYPIERMRLIDDYDGDDEASMLANNTSCFNYRRKAHMSSVSRHAYGEAVDINPLYNPYYRVTAAGARIVEPASAAPYVDRSADFPYKIERGDLCHRLFLEHGFHWGGSWTRSKDYQHFER